MKNLTAETQPLVAMSLQAANDAVMHVTAPKLVAPPQAWDPHEVWRTRILPYQMQQRLMSAADRDSPDRDSPDRDR